MAGLAFFKGKRPVPTNPSKSPSSTHRNTTSESANSPAYHDDVYHPAPSAPPSSGNIAVAVPVRYIPPSNGVQPLQPQSPQRNAPSRPATTTMTTGNDEMDKNLKLLHAATLGGGRTLFHKMFLVLNIVTALTGLNNIIAHLAALLFYGQYENSMEVVLRWYTIGLCLLVILIETHQTPLVQQSLVFQHFACRGVFYTFLGVLGIVEHDVGSQNTSGYRKYGFFGTTSGGTSRFTITLPTAEGAGELYITMTSWVMVLVGMVYVLLGTLCLHNKWHQILQDYQRRCDVAAAAAASDAVNYDQRRRPMAPIV